jgi:hypothetical protein
MKKSIMLMAVILLTSAFAQAGTSASTVDFLKKLNGYYYCLSREGVKKYKCDLICSLSPESEKSLMAQGIYDEKLWEAVKGFRFSVEDVSGQPISIQGAEPLKTGDSGLDGRIVQLDGNILESVRAFSQFWKAFVVEPLNDPADLEQGNLKFQRLADGFKVTQADPSGGMVAVSFDKKGKMVQFTMEENGSKTTVTPDFVYSAKGYLLQGMVFTGADTNEDCQLRYGTQGSFWMPKSLNLSVQLPGMSGAAIGLIFNFDHYQVNQ